MPAKRGRFWPFTEDSYILSNDVKNASFGQDKKTKHEPVSFPVHIDRFKNVIINSDKISLTRFLLKWLVDNSCDGHAPPCDTDHNCHILQQVF